jgi:hypothetical protein
MSHLSLLISLGFRRVGEWHDRTGALDFAIPTEVRAVEKSLYAFVVGSQVLYLGKAKGPFVGRMNLYRRPGSSQSTNKRINPLIAKFVCDKKTVAIYHFEPTEEVAFKGIRLNIAAGLEDPLIECISPTWNMHGIGKRPTHRRRR